MANRRRISVLAAMVALAAASLAVATAAGAAPGDRIWVRAYAASTSAEDFRDLAPGPRGSVYAVGVAKATEESGKLLVARYDLDGNRLWAKVYGAGGAASGAFAVAVPDGVIVAGTAGNLASSHREDILVVKYSANGKRLWATRHDGPGHRDDVPAGIAVGYEDTVYVGGTSVGAATGRDYVVLQIHARSGRITWTRRYHGPAMRDQLKGLHADVDGNVWVTGKSADGGGSTAAATLMYNIGGRRLWIRRLHVGGKPTSGTAVTINIDEQAVYVAGSANGGPASGRDVILAKLSIATGARAWTRTAQVPGGDEECLALAASGVHGWAIAGSTRDRVTGGARGFVASWAVDGTPLWQDTFSVGLPSDDALFVTAVRNSTGAVYCGGFTSGSGSAEDFTVVKYRSDGSREWANVYDGAAHGTDLCRDILVRGSGVYAGGMRSSTMLNTSALLIKYRR
jgi:hypothetical protein